MASPDAMPPDSPTPAPETASVWEDFLDIFYAPSQVFRRRANGNFWIPLLVVTVLISALGFANRNVMRGVFEGEWARNTAKTMQANPQITQDAMNKMRDLSYNVALYGTVVLIPIGILVMAFVVWLLVKLFQAKISWNAALIIASFAMVPRVLQQVALSVQGLVLDPAKMVSAASVAIGPARYLDPATTGAWTAAVANHRDLFVVWGVVLSAIGVAAIAKVPKAKAWAFGVSYWVITLLPALYGAWKAS